MTELEKCMAGEFYDCHDKVFLEMKAVATSGCNAIIHCLMRSATSVIPC